MGTPLVELLASQGNSVYVIEWLGRAFRGRQVVFYDDLADKLTSMTYGGDVARGISYLIGNPQALGQAVNIASPESKTWGEILNIYKDALEKSAGGGIAYKLLCFLTQRTARLF